MHLNELKNATRQGIYGVPGPVRTANLPLGGQNFPVFKKVRLKRGYISALVNCLALARAFGQPLAMQVQYHHSA
jgi:ABC-type phosphate transport system permease subunit